MEKTDKGLAQVKTVKDAQGVSVNLDLIRGPFEKMPENIEDLSKLHFDLNMSEDESEEKQSGKSYTKRNQSYEQQFKGKAQKDKAISLQGDAHGQLRSYSLQSKCP